MVLLLFQTVCRITSEKQCTVANAKLCNVIFSKVTQSYGVECKIVHLYWSVVQNIPLLSGAVLEIPKAKIMPCSPVQIKCKCSANALQIQCNACSLNAVQIPAVQIHAV